MVVRTPKASVGASKAVPQKDIDYTVRGLLALIAIVLITALFFAQPNIAQQASFSAKTVGGNAVAAAALGTTDALAPTACEPQSICDGTKLIRQQADCSHFEAFCTNGCGIRAGGAVCL